LPLQPVETTAAEPKKAGMSKEQKEKLRAEYIGFGGSEKQARTLRGELLGTGLCVSSALRQRVSCLLSFLALGLGRGGFHLASDCLAYPSHAAAPPQAMPSNNFLNIIIAMSFFALIGKGLGMY
jgi:hypothetical protein